MSISALYITAITILDISGTLCAKFYSINKNSLFLFATFMFFGGAGFLFAKSLTYRGMAITNILWISLSIIAMTIIGYLVFKENITPIQFIGIGIITIGLVLVNL